MSPVIAAEVFGAPQWIRTTDLVLLLAVSVEARPVVLALRAARARDPQRRTRRQSAPRAAEGPTAESPHRHRPSQRLGLVVGSSQARGRTRRATRAANVEPAEEGPRFLNHLSGRWRPLFATAIYAGMRKGELLGLRKSDIDFNAGLISIARSYGRETIKGQRAEAIPMARELVPYLKHAVEASPSDLVFPNDDERGSMMRPDVALVGVLRRALPAQAL